MYLTQYITKLKKHLAILTIICFVMQPSVFVFASPSATTDTSAPANNQADVREEVGNQGQNVTVVDIAEANANGLSHNKYLDFNVGPNGLILNNNVLGPTNTGLLNNLQINPNLQGRAASIILNEVTGPTPSFLNGTLEVGGSRASVIIANPNGIAGSGFGFINTNRVTLTTGTPNINGNDISFDVQRGKVSIYGDGLNIEQMPSKLDILTRATEINAELWADEELNIITGTNKIDYNTLNVTGQTTGQGTEPALALDVRALGGMYAGKIRLIGTEQGLGVNLQGEIYAEKDLILTNDGKITLKSSVIQEEGQDVTVGNITAGKDIKITATDNIIIYQDSQIASLENVEITGKNVVNAGIIFAGAVEMADEDEGETQQEAISSDLKITATEKISSTGIVGASNQVELSATEVHYEKQGVQSDNLVVNNEQIDLTQQPSTPNSPNTTDDHDNPIVPDLPTVNESDLIAKTDDDDLKLVADYSQGKHIIIDKTNSGIDLVQIATPSAAGVSKNIYTDFNIKSGGLILNNSTTYTDTQLGGWIDRNLLLGVSAKVILNEVTSSNQSQLNGFLEVAGNRASVVIANANGISVNGLGFINTSNATLNTYNSNLTIQGEGINASSADKLTLNSNSVNLNASEIYAQDLTISTTTKLTNNGRIITNGNIDINTNNLENTTKSLISSKKNLAITASGLVKSDNAVITTDGDFNINTNNLENTANTAIFTQGNLTLNATNNIVNNDSLIAVEGDIIFTAKNIDNINNSLIYADGDINLNAQQNILNQSASIESKQDIAITADKLTNEKGTFQTDWIVTYQNFSYGISPIAGHYTANRAFTRKIQTGTILNETASGQILADGNITINTNDLINHYSIIAASQDLRINTNTLENHGYQGTIINTDTGADTHRWKKKKKSWGGLRRKWKYGNTYISYYAQEEIDTGSSRLAILSSGNTTTINANTIENKVFNAGDDEPTGRTNDKPYFPNIIDQILTETNSTLTINNQLYNQPTNPNANYLIETDPRFKNKQDFLSSDYLYQRVKSDPEKVAKRLGDGYYEQKLVIEQITQLTGRKYLSDYRSELEQFKALMNNAVVFAYEYNLTIGVKLTKQQMAALTTDIVWLEEKQVDGQTVLVPVVYLASLKPGDMIDSGAVIIGSDVEIFAKDDLTNMGSLKADNGLKIQSGNITNKFGKITGKDLEIAAEGTITNQSGLIKGNNIDLKAQNIVNQTLTKTDEYGNLSQITIIDTAGIVAENNLTLTANDTIQNQGAVLSAGGNLDLTAKDIEITSVAEERHVAMSHGYKAQQDDIVHQGSYIIGGNTTINAENNLKVQGSTVAAEEDLAIKAGNVEILADKDYSYSDVTAGKKGSFYYEHNQHEIETVSGSNLVAGNNVTIESGKDILIKGSNIESEDGKISLTAQNDINIVSETEYQQTLHEMQYKSSGFLSKKKTTIYDYKDLEGQVGSNISGNQIEINVGNDINILASNVVADKDITINAVGDINIQSQEQTDSSIYNKEVKKSGLLSGGGFGFTIGKEQKKDKYANQNTTQVGSTVGSLDGNVNLNAGKDVNIKASDVLAKEDIYIEGNNVNIEKEEHIYSYQESHEYKRTGLTVSLGGTAGSIVINVYYPIKRSSQASDDRLKWMGAIKGGYELYKGMGAYGDYTDTLAKLGTDKVANAGDIAKAKDSFFQISVGFGTTKWSSNKQGQTIVSQGSNVIAEGNVTIIAREKDINIIGSNIEGENVKLKAQENVNIEAGVTSNVSKTDSKNSSNGIEANIGLGSGGFVGGITISGNKGTGKINENATTYEESTITAKDKLVIESDSDLNIIGSTVAGDKVEINVGGDLNIETLQDTDDYHEQNKNSGISVGVDFGKGGITLPNLGANKTEQNIDSQYKSNQEQAGIFAGEQGYDIYVEGNTDLKGAVIASEADKDDNKLSTGTITFEDIDNKAEWEAKTDNSGINISGGKFDPLGNALGVIGGSGGGSEGKADSTTKAAVSEGEIEIHDQVNQEQDIEDISRDTSSANNPLDKIFDREKILERQEAASMFGEMAFDMIGTWANSERNKYLDLAAKETDQDKRKAYEREAAKWGEGGEYKLLLHGLAGGIMAEINNGDFGEGIKVGVVNEMLIGFLDDNYKNLGLTKDSVKAISNKVGELIGGNQGGAIAESATENNWLKHEHDILLDLISGKVTLEELENMKLGNADADRFALQLFDSAGHAMPPSDTFYKEIKRAFEEGVITEFQAREMIEKMQEKVLIAAEEELVKRLEYAINYHNQGKVNDSAAYWFGSAVHVAQDIEAHWRLGQGGGWDAHIRGILGLTPSPDDPTYQADRFGRSKIHTIEVWNIYQSALKTGVIDRAKTRQLFSGSI